MGKQICRRNSLRTANSAVFVGRTIQLMLVLLCFNESYSMPVNQAYLTLTSNAGRDCFCPSDVLTYECTVEGGVATVWSGSALECTSSNNEIILLHSRYTGNESSKNVRKCGKAVAVGVRVENNIYTSQLNLTISSDMFGKEIICTEDTGNETKQIGVQTIITTEIVVNNFLPPERPKVIHIKDHQLFFTWESVTIANCSPSEYNIITDCGTCPKTTSFREATCTIAGSVLIRSCSFAVQSVLCSNTFSNESDPVIVDQVLFTKISESGSSTSLGVYFGIAVIIAVVIAVVIAVTMAVATAMKNKHDQSNFHDGFSVQLERATAPVYEDASVVVCDMEMNIKLDENSCYRATPGCVDKEMMECDIKHQMLENLNFL